MDDEVRDVAKATAEVAKTVGKAIDASRELGAFLGRLFGQPLEDAVGLLGADWLRIKRSERILLLGRESERRLRERGVEKPDPLPPKVAVPLLDGVSLEEDPDLFQMWVNLLVNASDPASGVSPNNTHVDILRQLSPAEAGLLQVLWVSGQRQLAGESGDTYAPLLEEAKERYWRKFAKAIKRESIHNLQRMGCIKFNVNRIKTHGVFDADGTGRILGPKISSVNTRAFERFAHDIELFVMTRSGHIEPEAFQNFGSSPTYDRYNDPETGVSLSPAGYFLMRACQPNRPNE